MRLIDADMLKEKFADMVETPTDRIIYLIAKHMIDSQPTAYDVDKVVDELDIAEYPYELFDTDNYQITEPLLKFNMVEDIVRRGGVE